VSGENEFSGVGLPRPLRSIASHACFDHGVLFGVESAGPVLFDGVVRPAAEARLRYFVRMSEPACPFVSRGGLKLEAALQAFGVDVAGKVCADLGCNVGGFTDCLLQRGAAKVYAVDSGYGTLAWKLRQDPRVVVMERTNAVHLDPQTIAGFEGADVVVIDLGWTRQERALPAAKKWLAKKDGRAGGTIVTLIKPHYEAVGGEAAALKRGILDEATSEAVASRVMGEIAGWGYDVRGQMKSPIKGGAGKGKTGNVEYLAVLG